MEVDMDPKALLTLSMKGGVGKTTTAVGLVKVLARRSHKVGLLDVDIHGSALPRALKLARDPGYEPLLGGRLRTWKSPTWGRFSRWARYSARKALPSGAGKPRPARWSSWSSAA